MVIFQSLDLSSLASFLYSFLSGLLFSEFARYLQFLVGNVEIYRRNIVFGLNIFRMFP